MLNTNINSNDIIFILCHLKNATGSNTSDDVIDLSGLTPSKISNLHNTERITDANGSTTKEG